MLLTHRASCNVWSDDDFIAMEYGADSPPRSPPNADFVVHLNANLTIVPINVAVEVEEDEEGDMLCDGYDTEYFYKLFYTRTDLLLRPDDESCYANISNMLSEVNVPEDSHENLIREISGAARTTVAEKENGSCSSLAMSVHIRAVLVKEPEEDMEEDVKEGESGANKTAVEALLEKMIVLEGEVLHDCPICLEVIQVGSEEGTRMPCCHMFHGGCILRWLEKSKVCPYCRFEMP